MQDLKVRIVRLQPMRVASVVGFGPSPEMVAWEKLAAWAGPRGLLADRAQHRIFGFNNPNPSPGSPNYGYEFWIEVGPDETVEGEAVLKEFSGGLYAVTRCRGVQSIAPTWQRFVAWREGSPHQFGGHQWLEEHLSNLSASLEELELDLFMPIAG